MSTSSQSSPSSARGTALVVLQTTPNRQANEVSSSIPSLSPSSAQTTTSSSPRASIGRPKPKSESTTSQRLPSFALPTRSSISKNLASPSSPRSESPTSQRLLSFALPTRSESPTSQRLPLFALPTRSESPTSKPLPSFALPTRSSLSKNLASSSPSKPSFTNPPQSSTLKGHPRELDLLLRREKFFNVKPHNPELPCYIAKLPSELRDLIYRYAAGSAVLISTKPDSPSQKRTLWPVILRVCRTIRYEASHEFYTTNHFNAGLDNTDFGFRSTRAWITKIPVPHRVFLSRNPNVRVQMLVFTIEAPFYSWNRNMLSAKWHGALQEVRKECRPFFDLDTITMQDQRNCLVSFARLAEWWLYCGRVVIEDIRWEYEVVFRTEWIGRRTQRMFQFLTCSFGAFALPCARVAKVTMAQKRVMKRPALYMLGRLDEIYSNVETTYTDTEEPITKRLRGILKQDRELWEAKVAALRQILETW